MWVSLFAGQTLCSDGFRVGDAANANVSHTFSETG
ncbi:hypothetical protein Halxa_3099 [Halopiger xanaduensis SH-6]|uniref:Uncharacterized protein n=1 Tax=Halopiger xanaduensis (strain DSM 18323 / JCM 14033 / SH-6) TaxID=797210 RepID=F8D5Y6_HALXS|nr:hypothetical protein Halxa_3099 [Halopiger xanaduensis SH-6]